MGWTSDETNDKKKNNTLSSKILLAIIICIVLIIILISVLLLNVEKSTFTISVDGAISSTAKIESLITKVDDTTYINIEEFAKLVKYEYHEGEYKNYMQEKNKCYVQGEYETASFYLGDNKIYKLDINNFEEEYMEISSEKEVKELNGKLYAPVDLITKAFNVQITEKEESLIILTLDYLVKWYDTKAIEWGYTGIKEQNFHNKKIILYGHLIVNKENGLYRIIDIKDAKEIVSDRYIEIQFEEGKKELFVTTSTKTEGIINLDGTIKIEPIYEEISVLDKNNELYLIKKESKYGVISATKNKTVIYPEYDKIGIEKNDNGSVKKEYLLFDTLIPVCKGAKWGAFDVNGNEVLEMIYDGIGCELTKIEVEKITKTVKPVVVIEECEGVVVKKDDKYGLIDVTGKKLVSISTDAIYINEENKEYYMLYNGKEMNILKELIKAGLIEEKKTSEEIENNKNTNNNVIIQNSITVSGNMNKIENTTTVISNVSVSNKEV